MPCHPFLPVRLSWENSPGNLGQAKGIIKLPIGQQPAVRGDLGPVKFQLQAAVEIDPKSVPFRFHPSDVPFIVPPIAIIHLIIILESALRPSEILVYLGNAGSIEGGFFFSQFLRKSHWVLKIGSRNS